MASKKVIIKNINQIGTLLKKYQLDVFFVDRDYKLYFESVQWENFFAHENLFQKESKDAVDFLNNDQKFLDVIADFLDSRSDLGWRDSVYELGIRHVDDGRITVGYNPDDKVYNVGKFQIFEDISRRWYLFSVSKLLADSYELTFSHTLKQGESVRFEVNHQIFDKIRSRTLIDGEDFSKFIEEFNEDPEMRLRLRFSKVCDLVNQKFKSKSLPEPITEKNWNEFYSDPKGFVTSLFKMPV